MSSLWKSVVNFFANPVADLTGGFRERKKIAAESAGVIAKAEVQLKLAELQHEKKRFEMTQENDADYDLRVLENRNRTKMDELLIITWIAIFVMHFIPATQPHMKDGWLAMGYQSMPWWFEFGIVGALISTLGLMRLFRLMMGKFKK